MAIRARVIQTHRGIDPRFIAFTPTVRYEAASGYSKSAIGKVSSGLALDTLTKGAVTFSNDCRADSRDSRRSFGSEGMLLRDTPRSRKICCRAAFAGELKGPDLLSSHEKSCSLEESYSLGVSQNGPQKPRRWFRVQARRLMSCGTRRTCQMH